MAIRNELRPFFIFFSDRKRSVTFESTELLRKVNESSGVDGVCVRNSSLICFRLVFLFVIFAITGVYRTAIFRVIESDQVLAQFSALSSVLARQLRGRGGRKSDLVFPLFVACSFHRRATKIARHSRNDSAAAVIGHRL